MAIAFTIVGLCTSSRAWQLLGVAAASLQSGLGEASCLAMTVLYGGRPAITAWSSGTGLAGIAGYAWVFILHYKLGLSFTMTLLLAQIHVILWLATYFKYLLKRDAKKESSGVVVGNSNEHAVAVVEDNIENNDNNDDDDQETTGLLPLSQKQQIKQSSSLSSSISTLTVPERVRLGVSLWPFMVPLFVVYFAEYCMQSGTWAVIGFPVHDEHARHQFYVLANWCYQAGVFFSRSAGMLWSASLTAIWIMPAAQLGFLLFFILNTVTKFWWNWGLLLPCFVTGLLGGSVYVQGFSAIERDVLVPSHREFALAAASVADSFGVALADVVGVLIQGCLFRWNGLEGADFTC
jgi:battenin